MAKCVLILGAGSLGCMANACSKLNYDITDIFSIALQRMKNEHPRRYKME